MYSDVRLKPLRVVTSSDVSMLLQSSNGEVPINVVVYRHLIDNYFDISSSSKEFRRKIVEANFESLSEVVAKRYAGGVYSTYHSGQTTFFQMVICDDDLENANFKLPDNSNEIKSTRATKE